MSALDDAREAVFRSDGEQGGGIYGLSRETRAMRDALRALIQHVGELEERIASHADLDRFG